MLLERSFSLHRQKISNQIFSTINFVSKQNKYSRKAEVSKSRVSIFANHHIFRFQIPMDNAIFVQMPKSDSQRISIEFCSFLWNSPMLFKMLLKIPSRDIVHDEEDSLVILKDHLKPNTKLVVGSLQNMLFSEMLFKNLGIKQPVLSYHLHGEFIRCASSLHKVNLSEAAFS